MLRRSPLLLGILLAYPLAIARARRPGRELRQLEAARRVRGRGQSARDRRARRQALRRRPHHRRGEQEREARASLAGGGKAPARRRARGRRRDRAAGLRLDAARDGPEPAAPAPALDRHDLLAGRAAGAGARLLAQPPAPARVHREQPPLRDADPARRRRQLPRRADHSARDREGTAAAARDAADAEDERNCSSFLHDARLALANTNDALSSTAHPIELVRAPDAWAHVGALGRGAGLCARADDHLPRAAARGRLARRRARRERRSAGSLAGSSGSASSSGRRSRSPPRWRWGSGSRSRSASG